MVRRTAIEAIGGYRSGLRFVEDYDLFVRLAQAGARFACIQEPLVLVRSGRDQRSRRGGWAYVAEESHFRWRAYRGGFLSATNVALTLPSYAAFRMIPTTFREWLYRLVRHAEPERDRQVTDEVLRRSVGAGSVGC